MKIGTNGIHGLVEDLKTHVILRKRQSLSIYLMSELHPWRILKLPRISMQIVYQSHSESIKLLLVSAN